MDGPDPCIHLWVLHSGGRATILPPPKVVRFLMPPYHPIFPSNVNVNVNVNREIFNVAKIAEAIA